MPCCEDQTPASEKAARKESQDLHRRQYAGLQAARTYYQSQAARRSRLSRAVHQLSKLRKLGSRSREQEPGPLKGPGALLSFLPASKRPIGRPQATEGQKSTRQALKRARGLYPSQALKRARGLFPAEFGCPAATTKRRHQKKPPGRKAKTFTDGNMQDYKSARTYYQSPDTSHRRTTRAVLIFPALHSSISKRQNANWRELHVRIARID